MKKVDIHMTIEYDEAYGDTLTDIEQIVAEAVAYQFPVTHINAEETP